MSHACTFYRYFVEYIRVRSQQQYNGLPHTMKPCLMQALRRRKTWWASIFFGASSQEASKEVMAAGEHSLLQEELQQARLSGDGSAADDERFSTNAEEMQRAAGEMDRAEGTLDLDQGSGETFELAVEGPSEPREKRCVFQAFPHQCRSFRVQM